MLRFFLLFCIDFLTKCYEKWELTPNKITELTEEAVITLYLDDATLAKIKGNDFKLLRVHNGDAEKLDAELNGNALTFKTSKFSTYSIAVKME